MNSPVFLGKICRFQGSETIKNDSKLNRGLALYWTLKNTLRKILITILWKILFKTDNCDILSEITIKMGSLFMRLAALFDKLISWFKAAKDLLMANGHFTRLNTPVKNSSWSYKL